MKKIILAAGILCCTLALLCLAPVPATHAQSTTTTISGKITSANYGMWLPPPFQRRVVLSVRDSRGKDHTLYCGNKTAYAPRKAPVIGDRVTAECIKAKGVWAVSVLKYK